MVENNVMQQLLVDRVYSVGHSLNKLSAGMRRHSELRALGDKNIVDQDKDNPAVFFTSHLVGMAGFLAGGFLGASIGNNWGEGAAIGGAIAGSILGTTVRFPTSVILSGGIDLTRRAVSPVLAQTSTNVMGWAEARGAKTPTNNLG